VAEANLPPPFQLERYYNKCEKYVLEKIRIWEASEDQKFRDAALLWKEDYEKDIAFYQKLETEDPARARSLRQSAKTVSKLITVEEIDFFSEALKQKGLTPKDYLTLAQMRALAVAKRKASQTTTTTPAIPSQTSSQQRGTGKKTKRNSLEVGGAGSQQKKQKVTTTPSGRTIAEERGRIQAKKLAAEENKHAFNNTLKKAKQNNYKGSVILDPAILHPPYPGTEDRGVDEDHVQEILSEMLMANSYATPQPLIVAVVASQAVISDLNEIWESSPEDLSDNINNFFLDHHIGNYSNLLFSPYSLHTRRKSHEGGYLASSSSERQRGCSLSLGKKGRDIFISFASQQSCHSKSVNRDEGTKHFFQPCR